jgi:predicted mannosyl-3-phosphoglycerate phosphatase (HAD superfamily)
MWVEEKRRQAAAHQKRRAAGFCDHSLRVDFPYNECRPTALMIRRTQTIFVTLDPFLSPRAAVLHHFDQFLAGLDEQQFPCVWLTSLTRAQLDEPRRRLGHDGPFIGESGCGVYLPEDYFHLKSGNTIRLGRFTCIPVAKPQPAAAEALEELSSDLNISTVSLRSLSPRELCQNTGLPASEAEQIRMRDFDELFFFAGATEADIARFAEEAKLRGLVLQNVGAFWSLSCGADYAKCIRELGGLYDRALRYHAFRVGVAVAPLPGGADTGISDSADSVGNDGSGAVPQVVKELTKACDRTLVLSERKVAAHAVADTDQDDDAAEGADSIAEIDEAHESRAQNEFYLRSPDVWESVMAAILTRR